jgi:hypothetical protein
MQSHDLARLLLSLPDMPVATHANNHTSAYDRISVGRYVHGDTFVLIGNFDKNSMNQFFMRVPEVYHD